MEMEVEVEVELVGLPARVGRGEAPECETLHQPPHAHARFAHIEGALPSLTGTAPWHASWVQGAQQSAAAHSADYLRWTRQAWHVQASTWLLPRGCLAGGRHLQGVPCKCGCRQQGPPLYKAAASAPLQQEQGRQGSRRCQGQHLRSQQQQQGASNCVSLMVLAKVAPSHLMPLLCTAGCMAQRGGPRGLPPCLKTWQAWLCMRTQH